jgi:hypothetical protein
MQSTPSQLKPALNEVQRTSYDQDLIEVPKRARLDREAEREFARDEAQGGEVTDPGAGR